MSVPDPSVTDWVPLYPTGALPIPPLQEGKWLKTQGGAMVWADLPSTSLPARLGAACMAVPGNDWNNAGDNGWYISSDAANSPMASGNWVMVLTRSPFGGVGYTKQDAFCIGSYGLFDNRYFRTHNGSAWQGWQRERPAVISGRVRGDGVVLEGTGFTVFRATTGWYAINPSPAFPVVPIAVASGTGPGWTAVTAVSTSEITVRNWNSAVQGEDIEFRFVAFSP